MDNDGKKGVGNWVVEVKKESGNVFERVFEDFCGFSVELRQHFCL